MLAAPSGMPTAQVSQSVPEMLSEIKREVFHCFDRDSLERLQMHSRYLRDFVSRHAHTLPLRYIRDVYVGAPIFS